MDFALADSVLHLNDDKRGHAGIFRQTELDVGIHFHIYFWANNTRKKCASAKMNTEMQKKKIRQSKRAQRRDQADNNNLVEWSVYSAGAGSHTF